MNNSNHLDSADSHFHKTFYEQFLIRIFSTVLSEPKYRNKLFGLSASLGYVNHLAGGTQLEDGTRALRESVEIALNANPDFIVMPEWNELNENTSLEPTVNRGLSTKRVMRYYMQKYKNNGKFTPVKGDDESIPNLILSTRAFIKLGEPYYVELLNVPDRNSGKTYRVKCDLYDEKGSLVKSYPDLTFDSGKLQEHRIIIPSEELAEYRTIRPVLTVDDAEGKRHTYNEGLSFTTIRTSWNDNLTCLKQALRDMPKLNKFSVVFKPADDGTNVNFDVKGRFER